MKNYTINHVQKTVSMTAAFRKAASERGTDEYRELLAMRAELPDYTFDKRTHRIDGCRVTYQQIEDYLLRNKKAKELEEFRTMRRATETREDGTKIRMYTFFKIRSWFLNGFPEAEEAIAEEQEQEDIDSELENAA